jgi:hypothetical protein
MFAWTFSKSTNILDLHQMVVSSNLCSRIAEYSGWILSRFKPHVIWYVILKQAATLPFQIFTHSPFMINFLSILHYTDTSLKLKQFLNKLFPWQCFFIKSASSYAFKILKNFRHLQITIFSDLRPCILLDIYRRFAESASLAATSKYNVHVPPNYRQTSRNYRVPHARRQWHSMLAPWLLQFSHSKHLPSKSWTSLLRLIIM